MGATSKPTNSRLDLLDFPVPTLMYAPESRVLMPDNWPPVKRGR